MIPTKKGLYYARVNGKDPVNLGALNKCHGLMNGFRKLGHDVDIVWYCQDGVLLNDVIIKKFPFSNNTSDLRNVLFHHICFDAIVAKNIDFKKYDFIFIRYPLSHPGFIRLLKKAKIINPNLRIFLEVPTYPYNLEFNGVLRRSQYWVDKYFSRFLKKYVDITVHYGSFKSLFGIPSIGISNGINVDKYPIANNTQHQGEVRLLAVGNWNHWHGLDRLLFGLSEYYQAQNWSVVLTLTIVGGGRALPIYQEIVQKYALEDFVKFIPPVQGAELDTIYDNADIAIGCLGIHRKNVAIDSSLKHREYAVRGVPFVLSTTDSDFPISTPWVHYCPADESAININDLIQFSKNVNRQKDLRQKLRNFAETHLDWSRKLNTVMSTQY